MEKIQRRSIVKKMLASLAGVTGLGTTTFATPQAEEEKVPDVTMFQDIPLYSSFKKHDNLVFISGIGAHFEGDIKAHTDHVLKELEKALKAAGSSMDKVLKVNVYLHDLNDYKAMNEAYKGRFGSKPPVRTTVAVYGGVPPGDSWVEIDCIARV
jgi:enamine deaminase RidA (YjgF/YER057c/UK114 family)